MDRAYVNQSMQKTVDEPRDKGEITVLLENITTRSARLYELALRVAMIADRLAGPRPSDLSKGNQPGSPSPPPRSIVGRLQEIDSGFCQRIEEFERALSMLESAV